MFRFITYSTEILFCIPPKMSPLRLHFPISSKVEREEFGQFLNVTSVTRTETPVRACFRFHSAVSGKEFSQLGGHGCV